MHDREEWAKPCYQRRPVQFGPLRLTLPDLAKHNLVLGKTGTGKSKMLRLLMQSTLPLVAEGVGFKGIVYDAKADMLSTLSGMGIPPRCLKILNPFDRRGLEWNLGADCPDVKTAQQIASIFVPPDKGQNRYFTDSARELVTGCLVAMTQCSPGDFTFRHFVLIAGSADDLPALLTGNQATLEVGRALAFLKDPKTSPAILTTIFSYINSFGSIAAAWSAAPGQISISQWVEEGNSILVLPRDHSCKEPLDAINRVLWARATQLILSKPDVPDDAVRTFMYIDEARNLGQIDLHLILEEARSRGCSVTLAFQDMDAFHDAQGQNNGNAIVAMCTNFVTFKLLSNTTAEFAADRFGKQEVLDYTLREEGKQSPHVFERHAVAPEMLKNLPEPSPETGLRGWYDVANVGKFPGFIPGWKLARQLLPPASDFPNHEPRDPKHEYLTPLTAEERKRFNLGPPPQRYGYRTGGGGQPGRDQVPETSP